MSFTPTNQDPFIKCITWTLALGRIVGAIPHTGILKWQYSLQFRLLSVAGFYTFLLTAASCMLGVPISIKNFLSIRGKTDRGLSSDDDVLDMLHGIYQLAVFLIYAYFLLTANKLIGTLSCWSDMNLRLKKEFYGNVKLKNAIKISSYIGIVISILGLGLLENLLFDLKKLLQYENFLWNYSILQKYFWHTGEYLVNYISYHPAVSILLIFVTKSMMFAWNYGDIFVIILCRLLTYQFTQFNDYLVDALHSCQLTDEEAEGEPRLIIINRKMDREGMKKCIDWGLVRRSFILLCDAAQKVADYVAPLVLICWGCNVTFMISNIFRVLNATMTLETSFSAWVSFAQFTMRVLLITLYTSELNHATEPIARTLDRCPDSLYSFSASRLEKLVVKHPVGVSLFGTFRITRNFFVSIIGFMFTTEIVLMQAVAAGESNQFQLQDGKHPN